MPRTQYIPSSKLSAYADPSGYNSNWYQRHPNEPFTGNPYSTSKAAAKFSSDRRMSKPKNVPGTRLVKEANLNEVFVQIRQGDQHLRAVDGAGQWLI